MEKLNKEQFENILNSKQFVVADFFANWCGPCKMISPILDEISKEYPNVTFCKIDVDQEDALAMQFHIDFIPNIIMFKDGAKVDSFTGYKTKQELKEIFDKFIG